MLAGVRRWSVAVVVAAATFHIGVAAAQLPVCAIEGQELTPATDDVDRKQLERVARRMLGPDVARIVRGAPWKMMWRGTDERGQGTYFVQPFDSAWRLPPLRIALAAPRPLTMTAEVIVDPAAHPCIGIEVHHETTRDDGSVTIRAAIKASITLSVGARAHGIAMPVSEVAVHWSRDDRRAVIEIGGLVFDLRTSASAASTETSVALNTLMLDGWQELLVESAARRGPHRRATIELLGARGFGGLPGGKWVELRRLVDRKAFSARELRTLSWLAQPLEASSDGDATVLIARAPTPRVFVAGHEITGWTPVGRDHELRVPVRGLGAIRVEHGRNAQAFVTVFAPGVRIRVSDVWGPKLATPITGARCGRVDDRRATACGHAGDPAPVGRVFDLLATCGGMPASAGSTIDYGVELVPSLPGLYVRGRGDVLAFDGTYRPTSCTTP